MGVFAMPSLGADMEAGTLTEWLVKPGDRVRRGDIVAVVETQKGAIEIEVFEEGEVAKLLVECGQTVPVGTPLAEIAAAGEAATEPVGAEARGAAAKPETRTPEAPIRHAAPLTSLEAAPAPPEPRAEPGRVAPAAGAAPPSSPAARLRAREMGIDLARLAGSGPGGAILLADVEAAGGRADARKTGFDPEAMRAAIAAAMARSKREIPHYYLAHEIDLEAAAGWLATTNEARGPAGRLVMGLLLVRATALAVARVPEMNGHWVDDGFRPSGAVHAGLAVSLRGGGLVAPALLDAESSGLDALMAAMRDLVERARAGRLRSSEVGAPTITISSLGDRGVDQMTGVIFPPQVALVGFGTPARRPAVIGDAVLPRLRVTATLAADHRASDGRAGARFLSRIADLLQNPEAL